jgi:Uncharacterized low-complexity proteins
MKFEVKNRFNGEVQFTADIECADGAPISLKLGLAVSWAIKSRADLCGADLRGAGLHGADLQDADLRGADLHGADLHGADLQDADLRGASLRGAGLHGADLQDANLRGADLRGADLHGADLHGADLSEIQQARLSIVPESGAFEAWKKCSDNVVVRLSIPADARRSNATGRKCRAEFVDVLEVIGADEGRSRHDDGKTVYRVGERVHCDRWEEDRWQECGGGIHFFITRAEAEAW